MAHFAIIHKSASPLINCFREALSKKRSRYNHVAKLQSPWLCGLRETALCAIIIIVRWQRHESGDHTEQIMSRLPGASQCYCHTYPTPPPDLCHTYPTPLPHFPHTCATPPPLPLPHSRTRSQSIICHTPPHKANTHRHTSTQLETKSRHNFATPCATLSVLFATMTFY